MKHDITLKELHDNKILSTRAVNVLRTYKADVFAHCSFDNKSTLSYIYQNITAKQLSRRRNAGPKTINEIAEVFIKKFGMYLPGYDYK